MNIPKLRAILRIAVAVATFLVFAATPLLQAYQLTQAGSSCSKCCCCGCNCGQNSALNDEKTTIEHRCCCSVSSPEPAEKIPFEAQPRSSANPDKFIEVTCATFDHLLTGSVSSQTTKIDIPLVHSPPLYILKSSYLI